MAGVTRGARRMLRIALALFLVVGNLFVIAQPGPVLHSRWNPLPRSLALRDVFLLPGMFNSYSTSNLEPFIGGLRTDAGYEGDRGQWVRLAVAEHLPHRLGVNFTRLFAMHHRDRWGKRGQQRAWELLAERIRERHHRVHPARPIGRVRFGVLSWPKSPDGYRARKTSKAIKVTTYYADPEDR